VAESLAPRGAGRSLLRQRLLMAFAGVGILVAAAYLALIIVTRIDELFFPGQGLSVGGLTALPGVPEDGSGDGEINILVLGLDRRPSEGDLPTRTDTLFILTIDSSTKQTGILGIPRDVLVEIPFREGGGYYQERINTAFLTGEMQGYPGGGPGLLKDVIERELGITIDHHVVIDFEGFIEIIDELGGIDVYVEEPIYDPFYSRTELPGDYYPLQFEVGEQHMDGQTALDYSRTRYGSSDLDRIKRQQQVIFAAMDKALERGLVNVDNLVDLWKRYKDAIDTDLNDLQAPGFARLAAQIDPARIVAVSIGAATRPFTTREGHAVLLVDKDLVQELVEAVFGDPELTEEAALVEVQNAAGADGLAAQVVEYLQEFGFSPEALSATNATGDAVQPLTEIIDLSGKDYTVERLARLLAVPETQVRAATPDDRALSTVAGADVLVILGADAQTRDYTVPQDIDISDG
jgi:LCP family protein required for cell wall assembly